MWRRRVAVLVLVSLLTAAAANEALATPTITGVRIGPHDAMTRLILDLTEAATFRIFTLARPDRMVIDLPPVRWGLAERSFAIGRAGVSRVRFGQFRPDTARIVLDLIRPVAVRRTFVLAPSAGGSPVHRLVVDFGPVPLSTLRAAGQPAELVEGEQREAHVDRPAAPAEPPPQARRAAPREPPPLPQLKPRTKPVRPLIAVDAGHGGRDPGAVSASGLREKTIVLTFAREFRAALEASGRYRAVLTRNSDHKIGLRRRVVTARNAGADLFLSIHVDRLDARSVRGASVYTLSAEASDTETAALAARENRADIVADVDLSEGYDPEVAKVLISLVQQNTMNCSAALAALLVPALDRVAPLVNHPHRFGDFRVLKAPDIPSVLIELGFLSNDRDAQRLRRRSHRAALAGAIIEALDNYYRTPC